MFLITVTIDVNDMLDWLRNIFSEVHASIFNMHITTKTHWYALWDCSRDLPHGKYFLGGRLRDCHAERVPEL